MMCPCKSNKKPPGFSLRPSGSQNRVDLLIASVVEIADSDVRPFGAGPLWNRLTISGTQPAL